MRSKNAANQPSSRFLQLPGELRNFIYQYALSYDKPLIYSESCGHVELCNKWPQNFHYAHTPQISRLENANPLKLVNRQMYRETRGMPLYNNELTFNDTQKSEAQCVRFLKSIAPYYAASIRRIIFYIDDLNTERWTASYADLRAFCIANPQMMLCMRSRYLSQESDSNFFKTGILSAFIAGRMQPIYEKLFPDESQREFVTMMDWHACRYQSLPTEPRLPENFRIFPWDEEFEESVFQMHHRKVCSEPVGLVVPWQDLDVWRSIVQGWYVYGI